MGRALVEHFASQGAHVALHYHSSEADAQALQALYPQYITLFKADLADEEATQGLIPHINRCMGPLNTLINCAAVFEKDDINTCTKALWDKHLAINTRAPFVLAQHFFRQSKTGDNNVIINVLDQRVWNLTPYFTSYTLSKSALWTLTQTLALAMAPHVRVNAIGPGLTLPSANQTDADFERLCHKTPLPKPVDLAAICKAAQFIREATPLTGQMLALDNGQHLGWAFPTPLQTGQTT